MKPITFFYVDYPSENDVYGTTHIVITDDTTEIELTRVRYGNVFFNKREADEFARLPKPKRERHYTDEERKQLEALQIEWGRSRLTEEEKATLREEHKSIDQQQWEFAMQMMGITNRKYKRAYTQKGVRMKETTMYGVENGTIYYNQGKENIMERNFPELFNPLI